MQNEIVVFGVFILNGILIGIIFDCFRILRKSFKTPDLLTYFEDIIFGISTGLLLLFCIMKFNNGELRMYLFFGSLLGLALYLLVFSKAFIKISVFIISIIKKIINFLIIIPFKFICKIIKKILFKPIVFICINVKSKIKKLNLIKLQKNTKNVKKEKDLI